jgi:hypothetical protein
MLGCDRPGMDRKRVPLSRAAIGLRVLSHQGSRQGLYDQLDVDPTSGPSRSRAFLRAVRAAGVDRGGGATVVL